MSKQEQIEKLQAHIRDITENRDSLARANASLSTEVQRSATMVNKMRTAWAADFNQEANFYDSLAERARNRVRAITGEYEV